MGLAIAARDRPRSGRLAGTRSSCAIGVANAKFPKFRMEQRVREETAMFASTFLIRWRSP
jgi:hypothetical protein